MTPSSPTVEQTRDELASNLQRVLVEVNGDRSLAAQVLGISRDRVNSLVSSTPALRARWAVDARSIPETQDEVINRPPPARSLLQAEKNALALVEQDKGMERSLSKMGFSSKDIEAIQSVEEFAGAYFEKTLAIMHGGMVKSSIKLLRMAEDIEDRYLQDEGLAPSDKRMWWEIYFRILENMRLQNDAAQRAAVTRAIIKTKDKGATTSSSKPGFTPVTAVQVNINRDVVSKS